MPPPPALAETTPEAATRAVPDMSPNMFIDPGVPTSAVKLIGFSMATVSMLITPARAEAISLALCITHQLTQLIHFACLRPPSKLAAMMQQQQQQGLLPMLYLAQTAAVQSSVSRRQNAGQACKWHKSQTVVRQLSLRVAHSLHPHVPFGPAVLQPWVFRIGCTSAGNCT